MKLRTEKKVANNGSLRQNQIRIKNILGLQRRKSPNLKPSSNKQKDKKILEELAEMSDEEEQKSFAITSAERKFLINY